MKINAFSKIKSGRQDEAEIFSEFVLDRCNDIFPHSNSVVFGNEFFDKNDEFPLLYTNYI